MKKTLLIIFVLISILGYSQTKPNGFTRGLTTKFVQLDTLTTTQRDALIVPSDKSMMIYNATVDSVQYYNLSSLSWKSFGSGSGGATQLSELSDVNTSTPTNRNVLVADGVDWESRSLVEADISDLGTYLTTEVDGSTTNEINTSVTMTAGSLGVVDSGGTQSVSLISVDGGNTITAGADGKLYSASVSGESTTVSDTAEINLTLTGVNITADIILGSIDETKLDASTNVSLNLADTSLQAIDLTPLETTSTIIDLSSTIGNYAYAITPTTSDTFTLTGAVAGGKADVLIDTTGDTDFPTVTGSTLINSSPFEAGVIYDMFVENNGNITFHYFIKRDISTSFVLDSELDTNGHSIGGDSQTATGDGTTTIDWKLGNIFDFQFGAFNETFTFTPPTKPGTFLLKLVQDSVGSRTVTFPASVKFPSGTAPTLTTTATTGTDIITLYYDGTNYFAVSSLNFQ